MDAKELRIGNLVKVGINALHADGGKNEIYEISELKEKTIQFKGFHAGEFYKDIDAIPITEEWLFNFGFYNTDGEKYNPDDKYADQFEYRLSSGISYRDFICRPSNGWIIKIGEYDDALEIKEVHKFQNLYFALTGEELEIKGNTEERMVKVHDKHIFVYNFNNEKLGWKHVPQNFGFNSTYAQECYTVDRAIYGNPKTQEEEENL